MKKNLFTFAIALLFSSTCAFAQFTNSRSSSSPFWSNEKVENPISWGAHIGLNFSSVNIDVDGYDVDQPDTRTGFNIGVDFEYAS